MFFGCAFFVFVSSFFLSFLPWLGVEGGLGELEGRHTLRCNSDVSDKTM